MAALLVVAIVPAMTPPHALPCEKIPPFFCFPLWFATLVEEEPAWVRVFTAR